MCSLNYETSCFIEPDPWILQCVKLSAVFPVMLCMSCHSLRNEKTFWYWWASEVTDCFRSDRFEVYQNWYLDMCFCTEIRSFLFLIHYRNITCDIWTYTKLYHIEYAFFSSCTYWLYLSDLMLYIHKVEGWHWRWPLHVIIVDGYLQENYFLCRIAE